MHLLIFGSPSPLLLTLSPQWPSSCLFKEPYSGQMHAGLCSFAPAVLWTLKPPHPHPHPPSPPPAPPHFPLTPAVSAQCHVPSVLSPRGLSGRPPLRCDHRTLLISPLPSCNKLMSFVIICLNSSFSLLYKLQKAQDSVIFVSQGIPGVWRFPNKQHIFSQFPHSICHSTVAPQWLSSSPFPSLHFRSLRMGLCSLNVAWCLA